MRGSIATCRKAVLTTVNSGRAAAAPFSFATDFVDGAAPAGAAWKRRRKGKGRAPFEARPWLQNPPPPRGGMEDAAGAQVAERSGSGSGCECALRMREVKEAVKRQTKPNVTSSRPRLPTPESR